MGLSGAGLFCILTGGLAVWRHVVIRCLLSRSRTFPMRAPQFLNDATARILLRRVGGGYSFTHRLLLDHLADAAIVVLRGRKRSFIVIRLRCRFMASGSSFARGLIFR